MLRPELIAGRCVDATLTEEGLRDAVTKGRELARRAIMPDHVESSSAVRCIQTGRAILDAMKLEHGMIMTDQLLEMDQGDFAGRLREEVYHDGVQAQIREQGKDFALPGGESMNQVGRRGSNWLESTRKRLSAQGKLSVLAIAHGGLITHTVGQIEEWDQPESLRRLRSLMPLGETRLIFQDGRWQVDYFAQPPEPEI